MVAPSPSWLTHGMGVVVLNMLMRKPKQGPLLLICFETWVRLWGGGAAGQEEETHLNPAVHRRHVEAQESGSGGRAWLGVRDPQGLWKLLLC